ncbi:hypothetical protein M0D21_22870, partial [Aquimarina sp. D1M17]|uniref:hypothetical protein n=1 Tax=Aquimarina acroporae TaxID=2937283 RepID=UPI0020BE27C2
SPNLVGTPTPSDTSCFGVNDGSVSLRFDNNVASGYQMRYFIYQGDPGDFTGDPASGSLPQAFTDYTVPSLTSNGDGTFSGSSASNLAPGSYYIIYQEVRFNGGSVTVKSGEITPGFDIDGRTQIVTSVPTIVQPSCVGDTGSVTLSSSGGTNLGSGILEYSIVGSNVWQSSSTFNNLTQGVGYRFISRRRFGATICEGTQTGLVTINTISSSLSINSATGIITRPYTPSSTNGLLRVFTNNGSSPYTYILRDADNGDAELRRINNSTSNPQDIGNLGPGNYKVEVIDSNGCDATTVVLPLESLPVPVLGSPVVTQIRCRDENNGAISISVSNGFAYRWFKDGAPFAGSTSSISGLSAGDYELEVIPNGGDFAIAETVVSSGAIPIINPIDVAISNPQVTNIDCHGDGDGRISLDIVGGSSYEYQLNNSGSWLSLVGSSITIVEGGFYDVQVRNERGCLSNILTDIFISEPDELTLSIDTQVDVSVFGGNDGLLSITVMGGSPSYSYEWSGDNGYTSFSEDISGLEAGLYTLTVRDANSSVGVNNGCVLIRDFVVRQPDVIEDTIVDPTCSGGSDGSISLLVNEGIGSFGYSWDNGMSGSSITGLSSGDYTVTITGLPNGTQQRTYEVEDPVSISIDATDTGVIERVWNPTSSNGVIRVVTNDGSSDYTYIVKDADNGDLELSRLENVSSGSQDIGGLGVGNYKIEVIDGNGCRAETDVIELPSLLVPQIGVASITDIVCYDDSNGGISIPVVDGFAYRWFKDGVPYPGSTSSISDLSFGDYELEVIPEGGDFGIAETVVRSGVLRLDNPAEVLISDPQVSDMSCFGDGDGLLELTVSGGNSYEYLLSGSGVWEALVGSSIPIANGGIYSVVVRNELGCESNVLSNIEVIEPGELSVVVDDLRDVSLFGGSDGSISISIDGGTPPYRYEWIGDNGFSSSSEDIANLAAGNYMLMVEDSNSTGLSNGCVLVEDFSIGQPDIIDGSVVDPTCYEGCDGSISLVVNGGIGSFSYQWSNGMVGDRIEGLCAGSYTVTVTGLPNGVQQRTYTLDNPDELVFDLPSSMTFCLDQALEVDGSIVGIDGLEYEWSGSGFSSQGGVVVFPEGGIYTVTARDVNGCMASHQLEIIESSAAIDAEFGMSSQVFVGEELIVVELSSPLPDSIEWLVPEGAIVQDQSDDELIMTFAEAGEYEVGLLTRVGDCQAMRVKTVLVLEQDDDVVGDDGEVTQQQVSKGISDFLVYPNPTSGRFTVDVELGEIGSVVVKVFSLSSNQMMARVQQEGLRTYSIPFDITGLATGVYAVVLETPYGNAL